MLVLTASAQDGEQVTSMPVGQHSERLLVGNGAAYPRLFGDSHVVEVNSEAKRPAIMIPIAVIAALFALAAVAERVSVERKKREQELHEKRWQFGNELLGIVFGGMRLSQTKRTGESGRGLARSLLVKSAASRVCSASRPVS